MPNTFEARVQPLALKKQNKTKNPTKHAIRYEYKAKNHSCLWSQLLFFKLIFYFYKVCMYINFYAKETLRILILLIRPESFIEYQILLFLY